MLAITAIKPKARNFHENFRFQSFAVGSTSLRRPPKIDFLCRDFLALSKLTGFGLRLRDGYNREHICGGDKFFEKNVRIDARHVIRFERRKPGCDLPESLLASN